MSADLPRTLRIGILVFKEFEPLDVWGFVEAFSISSFVGKPHSFKPQPFETVLISNECRPAGAGAVPAPVSSSNGPRVAPDMFRQDALTADIDVLMIPGGQGTRALLDPTKPEEVAKLLDWVRAMDDRVKLMTTVCTGAAVLASTGRLDGIPAATNHLAFAWVASCGPRVLWDSVSRYVDAGHYVTSAGVSAGTDMAFHLVSRLAGRAVAEQSAVWAEYDWHSDPDKPIQHPQRAQIPSPPRSPATDP